MTLTKADIVERISDTLRLSKKEATEVVESVFEIIKVRLEQGDKVKLSGFGNFIVHTKRPRKGRNPQTGEAITISGRNVLSFKASQVLKRIMGDVSATSSDEPDDDDLDRDETDAAS